MSALGVYGGSFDPPHLGHLLAATWALAAGPLDEIAVFPSAQHPLGKRPTASFERRMEFCRATFRDLASAKVDDLPAQLSGQGYTLDLLRALKRRDAQRPLRLVIGEDILAQTERWHAWDEVCRLAPPLVVGRQGAQPGLEDAHALRMPDVSSSELRARLADGRAVHGLVHHRVASMLAIDNPYARGARGAEP